MSFFLTGCASSQNDLLELQYFCCSAKLINLYRNEHRISASTGYNDPAVTTGISDLLDYGADGGRIDYPPVEIEAAEPNVTADWGGHQPGVDMV